MIIKHCLRLLANSLYSRGMITEEVLEKVCNENKDGTERAVTLLDCVEAKIGTEFAKFIQILKSDPFCTPVADKIVSSYNGGYLALA